MRHAVVLLLAVSLSGLPATGEVLTPASGAHATNATIVEAAHGFAGKANGAVMLPRPAAFRVTLTAAEQDPATVEASLGLDRPTRRLIQQGLTNEGFDPGAPDGLFGPRTRTAIRRWQESRDVRDVQASGYLNGAEAELLRAAASPQPVETEPAAPPPVTELLLPPAGSPPPVAPPVAEPPETARSRPPTADTPLSEPAASPPVTELPAEPSVNCRDWSTEGFFEIATLEQVVACLAAGVDPSAPNDAGVTPLHLAASSNADPAVIVALVNAGAGLESGTGDDDDATPLRYAATSNPNPDVLDALIVAGAELRDGLPHLAARHNPNPAVLEALLATTGASVTMVDGRGDTLLHAAAVNPNVAMIRWLLAAGMSVMSVNSRNSAFQQTPLFDAATNENPAVTEALLAAGADVALTAAFDITPLHYAAMNENPAVTEALLAAGADPLARMDDGDTPLHHGLLRPGAVRALVAAGADVHALNRYGATPLHQQTNPDTIAALLTAGANPNARDSRGRTPMYSLPGPETLEALLAAGANLGARDDRGRTPLHVAATRSLFSQEYDADSIARSRAVLETLIVAGANLEARDEDGNTPLHLASAYSTDTDLFVPHAGHALETLLDAGANATARNAAGQTPWDLARNNDALKGSNGYWRLNDARFNTPRQESRLQVPTPPGRPQAAPSSQQRRAGPACEIPGYPTPADVQALSLNWCGSNVSFQRRVFALQVAGAWCAISEGTSSTPAQLDARHREINAACDALAALQLTGFPSCQCPAGYRP